ncbi:MAG: exosortase/archaeosortase family protein [bacterium]|nr:exosortase/archaeosortase family protein [bacterium]MCP5066827.1 exosortase/archaeosortase family protein [bacterium]
MSEQVVRPTPTTPREWLLAAALLAVFAPALAGMADQWRSFDYLSHGFLVPVVSLWSYLREKPLRERVPVATEAWGAALIGFALLAYLAGLAAHRISIQGLAFVLAVAGAVGLLRGRAWLRSVAFPVAFLIFMVPPPSAWITPLIVQLRLFVSVVALAIVQVLGIDVVRDGNVLLLANGGSLFVAEACSGVTSVITLTPLAVVLGYYALRGLGLQLVLVVAVIPLAMLGNLTRVVATVALADAYGVAFATEGPLHELLGLSTYVVACLGMVGVSAWLRRWEET